jgi:uncharacterized protein (DUF1697 family)
MGAHLTTYVALLRAVNVGGTGKLPMANFRALLQDLGYRNVATYIQSGNAVFDAPGSAATVAKAIAKALEKHLSGPAGVLVRTHALLDQLIADNPFAAEAAADGTKVHAAFLSAVPPASAAEGLDRIATQYPSRRDRWHLRGDTLYLHMPDGAGHTKFTGKSLDRALGCIATGRNWNTVMKLHAMSLR